MSPPVTFAGLVVCEVLICMNCQQREQLVVQNHFLYTVLMYAVY